MKIGILTFHWATNYGAVLQAFALQKYLEKKGYNTEIIDYKPLKTRILQVLVRIKNMQKNEFIKEYKIMKFRKKNLLISKEAYFSNKDLHKHCNKYDVYICGSDQIWNQSFLKYAENTPTLSYFLDFVNVDKSKISYAPSFGTDSFSDEFKKLVQPQLEKFHYLSVREDSGKDFIDTLGLKSTLVLDPTLLLNRDDYEKLLVNSKVNQPKTLFSYILHKDQTESHRISEYVSDKLFDEAYGLGKKLRPQSVNEWIISISKSN